MARMKGAHRVITPSRWDRDNRAIIINRVSDARDRGHELQSDKDQAKRNRAWADARGLEIVAEFDELDVSGDGGREKLELALDMIREREVAWLIVFHTDRLGRDNQSIYGSMEIVDRAGGCIVAVGEGVDTSTEGGQTAMAILGRLAINQRRRIAQNWDRAQENAWAAGKYPGDIPWPLRQPSSEEVLAWCAEHGRTEPGHPLLQHIPDRVAIVREAATVRLGGASWPAVARFLTERTGGGGRKGSAAWSPAGTRSLLLNRMLVGEATFGGRFIDKAHEPVVTHATLNALEETVTAPNATDNTERYLLTGQLLRCAGCRYTMVTRTTHHGRYREYICRNPRCTDRVHVKAQEIEPVVEAIAFEAHARAVGALAWQGHEDGIDLNEIEVRLEDAKTRRRGLARLIAKRPDDEDLIAALDELDVEISDVEAEKRAAERALTPTGDSATLGFREIYDAEPMEGKRDALKSMLDTVFLDRDGGVHEFLKGTAPADLPSRGRNVPLAPFVPVARTPHKVRVAAA